MFSYGVPPWVRNENSFKLFWAKALRRKEEYDVNDPVLNRKRKLPSRFDHGEADHEFPDTPYEHYLRLYLEALDNVTNRIKDRFNQPGYQIYMKMENLLLKCVSGADYTDELNEVTDFYGEDLNKELLELQLTILGSNLIQEARTLIEIVTYLKSLPHPGKDLLSEVSKLMKLILVMPATNATSERSFSALKRIKSYLRSTIKQ